MYLFSTANSITATVASLCKLIHSKLELMSLKNNVRYCDLIYQ